VKLICKKLAVFVVGASLIGGAPTAVAANNVAKIIDGDTITMSNGEKVRLLQIDTPELSSNECYGDQARSELVKLLSKPSDVKLTSDSKLDKTDRYGRSLRYVFVGKTNINLKMVEIGAAAPYFYRGELGAYSSIILKAANNAKKNRLGLWGVCPGTQLTPDRSVKTSISSASQALNPDTSCDPNYEGCIPVFPPDLDCSDIKRLGIAPVGVIGKDFHKLDRDGDGIGCDR
jgi:endonuclease YncB( thermonuclease family)